MALSHSPKIVTNGLVLCLDAGNTKSYPGSGTTWTDLSGNGNNGTLTNGPTFSSGNLGSIVFDGVDDNVNAPCSTLTNSRSFTVTMWVKTTSIIDPAVRKGLCQGRNMSTGYLSFMGFTAGTGGNAVLLFESRDSTNNTYNSVSIASVPIYNTSWIFVGFQVDTLALNVFYHNGNLNFTTNADSRAGFTFNGWVFGLDASGFYWPGNISNFMFYNRVLSQAEISQNFNALRGRFGI